MLPGSLRKIPLIAAAFKAAERNVRPLSKRVKIKSQHIDPVNVFGPLAAKGAGQELTIEELISYITKYSDNVATAALIEEIGYQDYANAMFAMGLSWKTWQENFQENRLKDYPASPYEFAQSFRALYYSSYLRPKDSQEILRQLSESIFTEGLPAGAPGMVVAHKIGEWRLGSHHNDCGIIFVPANPYVLCIMTRGLDKTAATDLIETVSKEVFSYVNEITPKGRKAPGIFERVTALLHLS